MPPSAENDVPVYRGRLYHRDGSYSPVERWVRAANGDWISLDSERRTSRDIVLDYYPDMPCEDCEQGLSSCCIPPEGSEA